MKRVYKYILQPEESNIIATPSKNILSAESQGDDIVVYALTDESMEELNHYEFRVYGTGYNINDDDIEDFNFLNTVKMYNDSLMFHVFYRYKEV